MLDGQSVEELCECGHGRVRSNMVEFALTPVDTSTQT